MSKEKNDDYDYDYEEGVSFYEMLKFIIGIFIFIGVLFMNKLFVFYFFMFIVSYLLIGGEVVFWVFRNILRGKVFDENFLMIIVIIGVFIVGEYFEVVVVMLFY